MVYHGDMAVAYSFYFLFLGYGHGVYEVDCKTSEFKRATSFTTVNIDESAQGDKSVEYFFASDARYILTLLNSLLY